LLVINAIPSRIKDAKKQVAENLHFFADYSTATCHKLAVVTHLWHWIEVFKIRSFTDFRRCSGQEDAGVRGEVGWKVKLLVYSRVCF
jgi:hypothetical protein